MLRRNTEFLEQPIAMLHAVEHPEEISNVRVYVSRDFGIVAEVIGDVLPNTVEVDADQFAAAIHGRASGIPPVQDRVPWGIALHVGKTDAQTAIRVGRDRTARLGDYRLHPHGAE